MIKVDKKDLNGTIKLFEILFLKGQYDEMDMNIIIRFDKNGIHVRKATVESVKHPDGTELKIKRVSNPN